MMAWIMGAIIFFVIGFESEVIADALWNAQQGAQASRAEALAKYIFQEASVVSEWNALRPMVFTFKVKGQEHQINYNPRSDEETEVVKPLQKFSTLYVYYNPNNPEDVILGPTHDDAIAQVRKGTRKRPKSKMPETIKTACYVIGAFCLIVGAYKMTQQGNVGRRR